ncbi:hypothetical protein Amuc03_02446 [Akkermansia muciniphila]
MARSTEDVKTAGCVTETAYQTMINTQQKIDNDTGFVLTRQYLYDKGYNYSSVTRALLVREGIEVSDQTIRQICKGARTPRPGLIEAIKRLPKVVVC